MDFEESSVAEISRLAADLSTLREDSDSLRNDIHDSEYKLTDIVTRIEELERRLLVVVANERS